MTYRLGVWEKEKRGCSPGLGGIRGLVEGVCGDNGRVEWQLVEGYPGILLEFRVLEPGPISSLCEILG